MPASAVPLSGKLESHPLPAVLRELLQERRDGCLTVARGATTRRLFLRDGMIIYGSSTDRQDRLGEILVAQGKLSKGDHKKFWEMSQAGNQLLGITLVLNGRITLNDLYQGVTAQVVTILDRLQKWRKGDYQFEERREPAAGTVLLRIPLALYLRADPEKEPMSTADAPGPSDDEDQLPEMERIGEVSFMVQELRLRLEQGPFALLGVPPTADRPAIQAACQRITKVLQPDRLPKGCPKDLARGAEEIHRAVTAAAQAAEEEVRLKTTGLRAALRDQPVVTDDEVSRRHFAQARAWIAKGNYWQAADALRQAVRLKPEAANYRQYLGLALLQTKRLHEAEEHLVEAIRLEPGNAAHYLSLGRVYRGGKAYAKAREAFERALRLDPRNAPARHELADLPEEPRPDRKPESGGILKKIFGKS